MNITKRKFIAIETPSSNQKYVSIFEVEDEKQLSTHLFNEYTVEQLLNGEIEILEITDNPRLELNIQVKTKQDNFMSLEFLTAECINRKDLTLLADYLEKLPEGYENFDMSSFNKGYRSLKETASKRNLCGTAGCAIGHAPFVEGIPAPYDEEDWSDYSDRIAFNEGKFLLSDEHETLWSFMFGAVWEEIDNTPHGAARRIKAVLKDHEKCYDFFEKNGLDDFMIVLDEMKLAYSEFLDKLGV